MIYICAVLASGNTTVRLIVNHDGAWWWLKALAGAAIFTLLAALSIRLAKSMGSVTWRNPTAHANLNKQQGSAPDPGPRSEIGM